jgi:EAL domain-containing protein (putative c-di-GMP-specific phosphodiesterase class I)
MSAVRSSPRPAAAAPLRWSEAILAQLSDGPLAGAGRLEGRGGFAVGLHRHGTIASAFQPVVSTQDGTVVGHQAYVRAASPGGEALAPWSTFAHCADGPEVVRMDRLCRAVHTLNWLARPRGGQRLFLRVEQRLLDTVTDDCGHAFEDILAVLGASPRQVAIVLPASALDDPTVFVRAALAYRSRGYDTVAQLRSARDLARASLALAHPSFVIVPTPPAHQVDAARRVVQVVRGLGARAIARHVETAPQAAWANAAGFDCLQGYHFGRPAPLAGAPAGRRP